ncbi:SCO6745 family protein [Qaidamihabitans albus]|uniref:SCO6745 family protein n=1 Tax=Qaidamihabitans albus TaxID=2795733 RepID=UPI0018F261BC
METVQVSSEFARASRLFVQRWGGAFMTSEQLAEVEGEVGLGQHSLYFRGRAAVLGDLSPGVATEVFGIFPRWIFDVVLPAAVEAISATEAVAAYQEASARWARARLAGLAEPERLAELLVRLVEGADASGLGLFAGWREAAWPAGAVERVAHGLTVLREYRGGVHFAALRAVGLTVPEAVVADPEGGRGRLLRTAWQPEAADELIARAEARPGLRERWAEAERLTDERAGELIEAVLSEPERAELLDRLRALDAVARA